MTSLKQISNKFSGITFNFEAGEMWQESGT